MVFSIALRILGDRFLAEEVWERLGLPVDECIEYVRDSEAQLQFRSANLETSLATAEENIFAILRHLALAQPLPPDPRHELLSDLAASPDLFKVIVTSQPRENEAGVLGKGGLLIGAGPGDRFIDIGDGHELHAVMA